MQVIKKSGALVPYDEQKVVEACSKSASRTLVTLTNDDYSLICKHVWELIEEEDFENDIITVLEMHSIVEKALLELFPKVGASYREYRNYKLDFVKMMDSVYEKSQGIRFIGDVSNANTDSTMISTQRSLIYGQLNKELYQKFFLTKEEIQACEDGYIYVHDMKDRLDGVNCCLADIGNMLSGGFEMGNIWYNEPKSLDVAFDVISDITMSMASQQYGGFTIPRVDTILSKYAEMSYNIYVEEYDDITNEYIDRGEQYDLDVQQHNSYEYAMKKVRRDFEQGFQSWEYAFNTVGSSRGDYPFIAMSFGIDDSRFGSMASEMALQVRKNGQGKKGFKKPVLFPKLSFLYSEDLHGDGSDKYPLGWLFEKAIDCSSKTMYPDYLSLTGKGYIPSMYKKYGQVVSLMGCRASLSPWYAKGGIKPLDDTDYPIFESRCNLGAITLHLSMILAKARHENKDFYEVLDYYLEMIRKLHQRTYEYLGEKKASTNPLAWMQGGFLNGHLKADEKIKPLLKPMTMSFGITALNELQQLYNKKSLVEDSDFAYEVMEYINKKVDEFKEKDEILYAVYGTPAESLCGTQVVQFRKKYGIVEGVSDKPYMSNSFHCHVSEKISPIEKQDKEGRFWDLFNGGKIQYCRYTLGYNRLAIKTLVLRAMEKGFYEGVNLELCYCEDCGSEQVEMDICPNCGSENITKISRMNGYLGYSRVNGKTRYNDAKMAEIADRESM